MQTDYVITIARQFGAAGLPVAEELSRRLNIEYFNRVLVDRAAEELKIPAAKVLEEEELKDRLEYELDTINTMGFVDYFLIVWDFINYGKTHDVAVGPGRGSAAGSIVS